MTFRDLNRNQSKALEGLIRASESIDADLSFNADRRGLNDLYVRIEAHRVRHLLKCLEEFKALTPEMPQAEP